MSKVVNGAIKLVIGTVIFVGLPMAGWGVTDTAGFFSHPARLAYALLTLLLQLMVVIRLPNVGSGRGRGEKTVHRQRLTILLLQVIPLAIVIGAPYCDRRAFAVLGEVDLARYIGLALFALGFMAVNWAEAVLDRQFSVEVTIQKDHKLITGGPYRHLRHPRYLGIIVFTAGISLVFRSWPALILVALLTLVLLWRIGDEERLMSREFGEEWQAYTRRTHRLIPFIY